MRTVKIQFWSDSMDDKHIPKDTFKNLKAETIQNMMREALENNREHADLFASKDSFEGSGKSRTWTEERFVMVFNEGWFSEDTHEIDGVAQS